MIETVIFVAIVVACTVWYMRHTWRRRARTLAVQHCKELELLGERYCRGEINREEYLQKRGDILGFPLIS